MNFHLPTFLLGLLTLGYFVYRIAEGKANRFTSLTAMFCAFAWGIDFTLMLIGGNK